MKVTRITGGPLQTNCYILTDTVTGSTAVIDPGFESAELTDAVCAAGTENVEAILLTHGHFDHIMGAKRIKNLTDAKIYIYCDDMAFLKEDALNLYFMFTPFSSESFSADASFKDGDILSLGNLEIRVLHTPGHTIGSCCYLVEDAIFSGDTLMQGTCGRTDFPTGSYFQMLESLKRIENLKGNFHVYPGHEGESTLNFERKNNPYMGKNAYDFNN
jgi:hydroxyacylglutathione hydrolase